MTNIIKRSLTVAFAVLFALLCLSTVASAEEIVAEDILQKILVVYNMEEKEQDGVQYFPVHVYAAIDSLQYKEVGMKMTVEVISTGKQSSKTFSTTSVYSSMLVKDAEGNKTRYTPDQLGGAYIFGHEMLFTATNWSGADTKIIVTPYAINHSGDTINGKTIEITDEAIKNKDSTSALFVRVDKFDLKFKNTAKYLYRVGNANSVALGSLFESSGKGAISNANVNVTVENVSGNAAGVYSANTTDWTKGTIKFTGTGTVKVTVNEGDNIPTELYLEVVDGYNTTTAADATSKNIVLLNDCNFSTVSVTNGYTLYGNGFTMTCASDVTGDSLSTAFVTLDNGTLDNVRVICPNFSLAIMYDGQKKVDGNVDPNAEWRFFNIRSAVTANNNCKIVNSYISGGRNAINLASGTLLVDNTTVYGGATSNINVGSAQRLTLRDTTLIQEPIKANVNDTTKTLMGFSVVLICDGSGSSTPITLEGDFVQYAWANESYQEYVPEGTETILPYVLKQSDYKHNITINGTKSDWMNLGIAYMPFELGASVSMPAITDNRNTKDTILYDTVSVTAMGTTAYVYSYKNTNGTNDSFITLSEYESEGFEATLPTVSFTDSTLPAVVKSFDSAKGWKYDVSADLDTIGDYTFDFADVTVEKNGRVLNYTVTTADGSVVDKSKPITLSDSGVHEFILNVSDNVNYDANGQVDSEALECSVRFILTATKTSILPPEKVAEIGGTPLLVVKSKNSDWSCALPALEGTQIKYYSVSKKQYETLSLSSLTPTTTGKQNGTNNFWTYTDAAGDFTLTVTCGYIHEGKQVYGMPVVVNNGGNKMYFTISSTNGYVSTETSGRTVTVDYRFADNNGGVLEFSKTWQFNYADYKSGKQYSYSDFVNGTLKEASSGVCVTPDTLVTLEDGSQKRIDAVEANDVLKVWDFEKGEYAYVPSAVVRNHGYGNNTVIALTFSDGTVTKAVNAHGYFDADLNKFVEITGENAESFIGHKFVKEEGKGYTTVTLEAVEVTSEYIEAYSILTAYYYNFITDRMFSLTSSVKGLDYFMPFEVGANMTFDAEKMAEDIEKHGLYTYDDLSGYLTEKEFIALNMEWIKISVGKNIITWEELLEVIEVEVSDWR